MNMEEHTTTLLQELNNFNDVPFTDEDREELEIIQDKRYQERVQNQTTIIQVLKEAGINVYAMAI